MAIEKTLYEKVIEAVPELAEDKTPFRTFQIIIQDDVDGSGAYIAKWDYSIALPDSLAAYKR